MFFIGLMRDYWVQVSNLYTGSLANLLNGIQDPTVKYQIKSMQVMDSLYTNIYFHLRLCIHSCFTKVWQSVHMAQGIVHLT